VAINFVGTCFSIDAAALTDQIKDITFMCNSIVADYAVSNVCDSSEFFVGLQKRLDDAFAPHIFVAKLIDAESCADAAPLGEFAQDIALCIYPKYDYYLSKAFN